MGDRTATLTKRDVLRQRQSLPLDAKIPMSLRRIRDWYDHWDGMVYVAFSGGLDSTVLLHLVRSIYPDVPGSFIDTGLEYPESRAHVKRTENVTWLKPKISFKNVLDHYGYPVVSKRIAQYIREVRLAKGETPTKRLRLTGIRSDGTYSPMSKISKKWMHLLDAPFEISPRCCDVMKKRPAHRYFRETGRHKFVGTRAAESTVRRQQYIAYGCNAYHIKQPSSAPLSFWLDTDVREYLRRFNVPYSSIYDMGYDRTGCMFCMFGVHMENPPNRFQRMADTHPKQYRFCMEKLGLSHDALQKRPQRFRTFSCRAHNAQFLPGGR